MGPRSTSTSRRPTWIFALAGVAILVFINPAWSAGGTDAGPSLTEERVRLLVENASLEARLSLAKDPNVYLVADLEAHKLYLELQGIQLTSLPVGGVRLNGHAKRILAGADRGEFLQTPFSLEEDRWFEVTRTLAVKDSAAVRSRPDTTGALMQAIRISPVTALLSYDRRLNLVLEGKPPQTGWQRLRSKITAWLQSWSSGTLEGILRRQSADEVMVTLQMAPADIRSLAPTLTEGTKLVLVY